MGVKDDKKDDKKVVVKSSKRVLRPRSYKIKNVSKAISVFEKPDKLRFVKIKPNEERVFVLTSQERKDAANVEYRGKIVKRNDIVITEIK